MCFLFTQFCPTSYTCYVSGPEIHIPRLQKLLDYKLAQSSGVLAHILNDFISHWDSEVAKSPVSIENAWSVLVRKQIRMASNFAALIDSILDAEGGDYVRMVPPAPDEERNAASVQQSEDPRHDQGVEGMSFL